MIIYKTTNLITNQFYIGKDSKNDKNYLGSGIYLKRSIKKYGKDNFIKEIIEECTSLSQLAKREQYWIDKYNACKSPNSFNISTGGEGGDTLTNHSDRLEILKRISIGTSLGQTGRKHTKETIEKIKKSNIGIKKPSHTEEWKKNISKKLKGAKKPPRSKEHSKKISDALKGSIPSNKGIYIKIPDNVIHQIINENINGKSITQISMEYGYSRYILTNNINKYKNKL